MDRRNVRSNAPALTQSAYREAVAETVSSLQGSATDQDMADTWGVSAGTIVNVRKRSHDLSAVPLLKIGKAFGVDRLGTILALIGAKAVPLDAVHIDVSSIPCDVAGCLPTLIRLFADGDASDADIRQLDREGVIDCFSRITDMLEQRRDDLRLKAVRS